MAFIADLLRNLPGNQALRALEQESELRQAVVKNNVRIGELESQLWDAQCRLQVLKDAGCDVERVDYLSDKGDPLGGYTYKAVIRG